MVGNHHLVFKVTADCNERYLNKINYPLDKIIRGDQCLYTVCQDLRIWQPATIDTSPFVNSFIVIIVLLVAIVVWWVYTFVNYKKLEKDIYEYQNLNEEITGNSKEQFYEMEKRVGSSQGSLETTKVQNVKEK
jgi:hypothetical protein